jgi:hypothetical protein
MAEFVEENHDRQDEQKRDDVPDEAAAQYIETPKQIRSHRCRSPPARSS